jgi:hypothetical protein
MTGRRALVDLDASVIVKKYGKDFIGLCHIVQATQVLPQISYS